MESVGHKMTDLHFHPMLLAWLKMLCQLKEIFFLMKMKLMLLISALNYLTQNRNMFNIISN